MRKKSRGFNVVFNSLFGMIATLVSSVMTFAVRTVLSRSLGEELYGINTLFASIISTLLIMELGISTAMTIYLYEPVAKDNREKVKSIIRLYRNVYRVFCAILFGAGIIVDIFILPHMVSSSLPIQTVRIYFIIFLLSITVKYLWYYKRSLLFANQRNRISTGVTAGCEAFFGVIEIIVLLYTKNYYFYLVLLVLQNTISNAICNIIVNRDYPFITEKRVEALPSAVKKSIANTIKPMFVQRIAGVVQDSSIAVILSFISESVATVGFYGNYQLVMHTAQSLFSQIGAAFTTSFGNFSATEDPKECYRVYKKSRFLMNWLTVIISGCFMVLVQMFVSIFFGSNYVLSYSVVIIMTLYLYGYLNNVILISIQNAMGLHRLDAKQMVFQTLLNIALSLGGGLLIGLEGILLGSLLSMIIFSTLYKGKVIYEKVFNISPKVYYLNLLDEYIRFLIPVFLLYFSLSKVLINNSVLIWIGRAIVAFFLINIFWAIVSCRHSEFKYLREFLIKKIRH